MIKKYTFLLIFFLCIISVNSQNKKEKIQSAISAFEQTTKAKISLNRNLETPRLIKFPINNPLKIEGNNVKSKVNTFLETNKAIYSIENVKETLKGTSVKTDRYGLKNYTLTQEYKGVPIYDAELKFHFDKNNDLKSINGNIIPNIDLNIDPRLNKKEACDIALNLIKNQNINKSGKSLKVKKNKLLIFPKGLAQGHVTSHHLAYRIEVTNNSDVREYLFIDAHTGKLIQQFTGIAHALNRSLYEGDLTNNRYTEGGSTFFLTQWGKNEIETAGHVYYFFKNAFGFISFDNEDGEMITINNNPDIDCPNATWNGTTTNYCDGTASDDVVAHEWGHAYTDYTSNLIYEYESGALNEAFSDIWGETIDLLNNYEDDGEDLAVRSGLLVNDRWKMGEDASGFGGAIRDMWDPTIHGDPGKVSDANYWCDTGDNGGVHVNSGIPNRAYSLIVDGGQYNGQTIIGLGFTKAAHIFWRVQSEYLTQTSDFSDFANAVDASCSDLVGINLEGLSTTITPAGLSGEIITTSDYNEVLKALIAVELSSENNCSFAPLLVETEPICAASINNPIFTENWESGIGSEWIITQLPSNPASWENRQWMIQADLPKERQGQAIYAPNPINGDCDQDLQNGIIRLESPSITIPDYDEGSFELAFNHNIASEAQYDGGNLKFSIDSGQSWSIIPSAAFTANPYNDIITTINDNDNPMITQEAFTGTDENSNDSVWGQSVINLSDLGVVKNSNLKLRWEFGSDGCNGVDGWYIDDIFIYNCTEEVLSTKNFELLNNNLSITPNPTSGIVYIEMKNVSNLSYTLFDITGKTIKNKVDSTSTSFKIDLGQYSKGVYFLKLQSEHGTITKKLIHK